VKNVQLEGYFLGWKPNYNFEEEVILEVSVQFRREFQKGAEC
jgi:hypothetical protein